jgi:hypothetical protein
MLAQLPRGAALAGGAAPAALRTLLPRQDAELRAALSAPALGLAPSQAAEALRVLRSLPALEVRWTARQGQAAGASGGSAGGGVLAVSAGGEDVAIAVELQVVPPPLAVGRHAFAPRFRARTYGWWLVVGEAGRGGELLAAKRIGLHSGSARHELSVPAPAERGAREWQLLVVSDTIAGLDVQRSIRVNAVNAT